MAGAAVLAVPATIYLYTGAPNAETNRQNLARGFDFAVHGGQGYVWTGGEVPPPPSSSPPPTATNSRFGRPTVLANPGLTPAEQRALCKLEGFNLSSSGVSSSAGPLEQVQGPLVLAASYTPAERAQLQRLGYSDEEIGDAEAGGIAYTELEGAVSNRSFERNGNLLILDEAHPKEKAFAQELVGAGNRVIVRGLRARGNDYVVNGQTAELKTLEAGTRSAVYGNLRDATRQAKVIYIDGRPVGLSQIEAQEGLAEAQRKTFTRRPPDSVKIYYDGGVLTYP